MESLEGLTVTTGGKAKVDWRRYGKRYRAEWEKLPDCEGWLAKSLSNDPAKARCKLCRKELRAHLGDIKKHSKSDYHKHMMKITMGGKIKVEGYHIGPKYTRMANGYKEEWEDEPECEGWLSRSEYGAKCNVCNTELMPKLNELKKHGRAQKHLKAMTALWDKQGMAKDVVREELKPSFQPWQLPDIKKRDFELKVSLVAGLDMGFRGVKDLCGIMEERLGIEMYNMTGPQCESLFKLVLVPYFREFLKRDMKDAPFSLIIDDASNMLPTGEVSACIYYFSRQQQKAISSYLGLLRIDRGDINVLVESINSLLQDWDLYGYNMVSLITDGIAEACPDREALVTLLVPTCPNLLHLHSSFASLSYAFHNAVKKSLPASVEFMLRECYNWFADGQDRQNKYTAILQQVGLNSKVDATGAARREGGEPNEDDELASPREMVRISPDASQWLSIADYTTGLFLHYDALKVHFERVAAEDGCFYAGLLNKEFSSEHNRLYFTILQPMLTEISDLKQQLAAVMEKSKREETNANLCEQIEGLFLSLASQILEPDTVASKTVEELCDLSLQADAACVLKVAAVNYGPNFSTILEASPLKAADKAEIKGSAAKFLKELFVGLQFVLKDTLMIMKSSEHFQLPNFFESDLELRHLTAPFFDQDQETIEHLMGKYRLMKMLEWKNRKSTLAFWQEVHDFGDSTGNFPLRVVSNGVWKMLCVPLFNQDITRLFRVVNGLRKSLRYLEPDLVEAVLVCRIGLKRMGKETSQFQPPPELIRD